MAMAKQMVELDVDIPEGWEVVRVGYPAKGEFAMWGSRDAPGEWTKGTDREIVYVIVRRVWQWPEWLTADWIAMDSSGEWYGYDVEPGNGHSTWSTIGKRYEHLDYQFVDFTPPPCTDWRESKRKRPGA